MKIRDTMKLINDVSEMPNKALELGGFVAIGGCLFLLCTGAGLIVIAKKN